MMIARMAHKYKAGAGLVELQEAGRRAGAHHAGALRTPPGRGAEPSSATRRAGSSGSTAGQPSAALRASRGIRAPPGSHAEPLPHPPVEQAGWRTGTEPSAGLLAPAYLVEDLYRG